jgi:hypothetical protein
MERVFPKHLNTLSSGHAEIRDCSPMRCWWVTHFCVFIHFVLHIGLASDLAHLSLQVYRQIDAGCWVSSYCLFWVCVLTLVIQYAERKCRVILYLWLFRFYYIFSTSSHKLHDVWAKVIEHIMCDLFSSTSLLWNLILGRIRHIMSKLNIVFMLSTRHSCQILMKLDFSHQIF